MSSRDTQTVLIAIVLVGALLSGCGSQDRGSTKSSSVARTGLAAGHPESRRAIVAAAAACRQGVDTASWMSQADKQRLYEVCNYGLRRGLTEIQIYGLQVCDEVTFASPAKTAAEKAHVFSTCYAEAKRKTAAIE